MTCPPGQYKVINMLGQEVCLSPHVASGYYLYSDEAVEQMNADNTNPCGPTGIRPGQMVIRGAGSIPTCAGRIVTEQLPDIHLVNNRFRPWLLLFLGSVVVGIGAMTLVELFKWLKR